MNERIRELAEQAGINCVVPTVGTLEYPNKGEVDHLKKFAELIVRQCGYYADIFESAGCPVDMDPTETKPSDYIKKHFGVEE